MHVIKSEGYGAAVAKLAGSINAQLARHKNVLWLVSGGSAIDVAVAARDLLQVTDGLTVMQVDERFGPVGHAASNWRQLIDAGFNLAGVRYFPVLSGRDAETTCKDFAARLDTELATADYVTGLFGLGSDDHTAGILPRSVATQEVAGLACLYDGPDYQRITITGRVFPRIDEAVVYAAGAAKLPALEHVQAQASVEEQPAQLLKQTKQLWIYNDQIGEAV